MAHFPGAAFAQRRVEARVSHENLCPVCDSANSGYVLTRNQMRLLRCQGCDLIRLEPRKKPSIEALPQQKLAQPVVGQSDWALLFEALRSRLQKRETGNGVIRVGFSGPVAPDVQMTAAR